MLCTSYLASAGIVAGRVRGMANDEVGGGEESNNQMRLSSGNPVPSSTLQSLVCVSDLTPGHKMAAVS